MNCSFEETNRIIGNERVRNVGVDHSYMRSARLRQERKRVHSSTWDSMCMCMLKWTVGVYHVTNRNFSCGPSIRCNDFNSPEWWAISLHWKSWAISLSWKSIPQMVGNFSIDWKNIAKEKNNYDYGVVCVLDRVQQVTHIVTQNIVLHCRLHCSQSVVWNKRCNKRWNV